MKKIICLILSCSVLISVFAGCSKKTEEADTTSSVSTTQPQSVDLDLSEMSGTAVYSEVYNIMSTPEDYLGKIIKIKGNFQIYQDLEQNKMYYSCVIPDATACCQQGIEFVPSGIKTYPRDFPALDSEITVSGEFSSYNENGTTYYTLKNSTMKF